MNDTGAIVKREISYYEEYDIKYKKFFKGRVISGLILFCKAATQNHESKDKLISGFIAGLALLKVYLETQDQQRMEESNELLKPGFDLIIKYLKSPDYVKQIIDAEITGESILVINGEKIPITAKAILLHIGRIKAFPLTPVDIAAISRDFKQYSIDQNTLTTQPLKKTRVPKVVKPFTQYFLDKYREVLPELCKSVFNARNSQKDYAIMVCLLREKYLISFTPTHFYKAWYIFIGRTIPEGENFNAITKNYIEREVGDFDVFDNDYKTLKKAFENELKTNKIS